MHLTVTGKQIDTGAVLRQHVEESLGAIPGKYLKTAIECVDTNIASDQYAWAREAFEVGGRARDFVLAPLPEEAEEDAGGGPTVVVEMSTDLWARR